MKRILVFVLIIKSFTLAYAQQSDAEIAALFADTAQMKADSGLFKEAVQYWDKATALDMFNLPEYRYRIAKMYYDAMQFKKTNSVLKKILNRSDLGEKHYLLAARSLIVTNKLKNAVTILNKGREKYPQSGEILYELGFVEMRLQKFRNAVSFWELGIKTQPECALNYYGLTKIYAGSPERLWALFYGEIFLNIERSGPLSEEISHQLFHIYKDGFLKGFSQAFSVNLPQTGKEVQLPFPAEFEKSIFAASDRLMKDPNALDISTLIAIRKSFLERWAAREMEKRFPNQIFAYLFDLSSPKEFEAYHYWLFRMARKDEFNTWKDSNEELYDSFLENIDYNYYKPQAHNLFLRTNYVR